VAGRNALPVCVRRRVSTSRPLPVIHDLRSPLFHLHLYGHLLQTRRKRFDLLSLACNGRFHSLDFARLFEEFTKQHRVHCVVTNGLESAVVIAFDQVRNCFLHFLSDKAGGITEKCPSPGGGIVISGIDKERPCASGRVELADRVTSK
jgi:hypothetical protein